MSIGYNQYLHYQTLTSPEAVWNFVNNATCLYSNCKDYLSRITRLLEYRRSIHRNYNASDEKRAYSNIYAYSIEVMLPQNLTVDQYKTYIKNFAINIDYRFKQLLYVYDLIIKKTTVYAQIVFFTRKLLATKTARPRTYKRNYYYDYTRKRFCKENVAGCILLHAVGDPVLDETGVQIIDQFYVKETEERIFIYRPGKGGFVAFINVIKHILRYADSLTTRNIHCYRSIKKLTYKGDYKTATLIKIKAKNSLISRVNAVLAGYQDALHLGGLKMDPTFRIGFNKLLHTLSYIVTAQELKYNHLTIKLTYNISFENYKKNLAELDDYISSVLEEFHDKYYLSALKNLNYIDPEDFALFRYR